MIARFLGGMLAVILVAVAPPAAAQLGGSDSTQFLSAVKDAKGDDVEKLLNKTNNSIIDARARDNGEGALHYVVKRDDATYLRYLLGRGADPNVRDDAGNSPVMTAVISGNGDLIDILAKAHADVDLANRSGETPLIMAVHRRDTDMIRTLLNDGADPDQSDHLQGLSARQYAHQDTRGAAIARLIDETATKKKKRAAVAGPRL